MFIGAEISFWYRSQPANGLAERSCCPFEIESVFFSDGSASSTKRYFRTHRPRGVFSRRVQPKESRIHSVAGIGDEVSCEMLLQVCGAEGLNQKEVGLVCGSKRLSWNPQIRRNRAFHLKTSAAAEYEIFCEIRDRAVAVEKAAHHVEMQVTIRSRKLWRIKIALASERTLAWHALQRLPTRAHFRRSLKIKLG